MPSLPPDPPASMSLQQRRLRTRRVRSKARRDAQLTRQIDTNLFGVLRTTQAFFRTSANVAAEHHHDHVYRWSVAFPFNSVYHATKWALEG